MLITKKIEMLLFIEEIQENWTVHKNGAFSRVEFYRKQQLVGSIESLEFDGELFEVYRVCRGV